MILWFCWTIWNILEQAEAHQYVTCVFKYIYIYFYTFFGLCIRHCHWLPHLSSVSSFNSRNGHQTWRCSSGSRRISTLRAGFIKWVLLDCWMVFLLECQCIAFHKPVTWFQDVSRSSKDIPSRSLPKQQRKKARFHFLGSGSQGRPRLCT